MDVKAKIPPKDKVFRLLADGDVEVYYTFTMQLMHQDELKEALRIAAWFDEDFHNRLVRQLKEENLEEWFNSAI